MPIEAVLEAHSAAREQVLSDVKDILTESWLGLGSWDQEDVADFVEQAEPTVNAGQDLTGMLVDQYVSESLSELTKQLVIPRGIPSMTNLRGTPFSEVYARPFVEVWTNLRDGQPFEVALERGLDRLTRLGEDDLTLAYREATRVSLSRNGVTFYRRVIRPELSGAVCGLCVAASGQRYKSDQLMPIHTHCRCAVMPIIDGADPGREINGQDIDSLYREASKNGRTAKELSNTKFTLHEHGELGPMLMPKGQQFATL